MGRQLEVVGIGEVLWDMLPSGRRLGGAPTNFSYHVNALGVPAAVVSCVGNDSEGSDILQQVAEWGMSTEYISVQSAYPTGVVQVQLEAKGSPSYVIVEDVAWDHLSWNENLGELAGSLRAVCFGTLGQRSADSRSTIRRFIAATDSRCLRICDINLRQKFYSSDLLHDSLQMANVLKLNDEELPIIARAVGIDCPESEVLQTLRDKFSLQLIALTRGSAGSVLFTETGHSEHPGITTSVVDTVGAGDAFTAALVVGLLHGDTLDTINQSANETAARVCSHSGAIP